ncbi:MAG: hypothetical protein ACI4WW_05590 [Candidatus Coprovivens sp.]
MNENIVSNIKDISSPKELYYGEWVLDGNGLKEISNFKKEKNLYEEFLNRYYYLPLSVVFKDENLTKGFSASIVSKLVDGRRKMYFSKKTFLSNIISNIDEVIKDDDSYKLLKKALRVKKDVYRDVYKLGTESEYYKEVLREYNACNTELSFEKFVALCKKKYTRLLSGYNTVLELLDKPINVTKLLDCFKPDQFYLYVCYSILDKCEREFETYGKVDINIKEIDKYLEIVKAKRKEFAFYNSHVISKENTIVTIDDLIRRYNILMEKIG